MGLVVRSVPSTRLLANFEVPLYRRALSSLVENRMARPVRAAVAVRQRRVQGALQGDENAQAQDQERRQETLEAHGHRQAQAWGRWQAPPADQPQRQIYSPE